MRRLAYTVFVAFWSSVATFWLMSVLAEDPTAAAGSKVAAVEADTDTASATATATATAITMEELERHTDPDDCWIAVDGVVYDVSDYIAEHPTPPGVVTRWCGKEATEPYRTKGYGAPHSPEADARLAELAVGPLATD